jgi:hypothetical protein
VPAQAAIAFTVCLSHDITPVGPGQIINFDHIVTNIGNSYNPHGGLFTARVPGVYLFSVTAMALPNQYINVEVVKNDVRLVLCYHVGESGTCVVTVHLATGEDVWVKHSAGNGIRGTHSTFSGVLITPDGH